MAKKEDADAPRGRLLFTDFAISEKGRPPALSLSRTAAAPARPLPTLRDVISSLDINFEDDDDDRSAPDFSPSPGDDGREDDAGPDPPRDASIEDGSGGDPEPAPGAAHSAVPLDGFLSAFMSGSETDAGGILRGNTDQGDDAGLDPDFSFASLLTRSSKKMPDEPPSPPKDGTAAGVSGSGAGEGVVNGTLNAIPDPFLFSENVDPKPDARIEGMGLENRILGAHQDIGPEDDILSLMSPESGEMTDAPAGRRMTRTRISPPRSTPYGGLKRVENWYVPPERSAGAEHSGHPAKVEDWYEPPESAKQSTAAGMEKTAVPGSADELFGDVDIGTAWQARSALEKADGAEPGADDDLFAEFANLLGRLPSHANTAIFTPAGAARDAAGAEVDILSEVKPEESARFRQTRLEAAEQEDALPDAEAGPERVEAATVSQTQVRPRPESAAQYRPEPAKAVPSRETRTDIRVAIDFVDDDGRADAHPLGGNAVADASPGDEPFADESGTVAAGEPSAARASKDDEEAEGESAPPSAGAMGADAPMVDCSAPEAEDGGIENADALADPSAAALSGMEDSGENIGADAPDSLADAVGGGPVNRSSSPSDAADGDGDLETGRFRETAASEDDYLPGSEGAPEDGVGGESESAGSNQEKETRQEEVAVNPMDVFANMDALDDFGGDSLDDEMRAMLDNDDKEEERKGKGAAATTGEAPPPPPARDTSRIGRIMAKIAATLPVAKMRQISALLAWRENWWFYCDLIAAIIATASLAVIASYFMWYR